LSGQVALQLADLAAVAHDNCNVCQIAVVVDVLVQDPLRDVAQLVHRRGNQMGLDAAGNTCRFGLFEAPCELPTGTLGNSAGDIRPCLRHGG